MSFASALQTFARQAARERAQVWPATVSCPDGRTREVSKSATRAERAPQEMGAGWVQRTTCTLEFLPGLEADAWAPEVGHSFTLVAAPAADEVGTVWRVATLTRSAGGGPHVAQCWRVDD